MTLCDLLLAHASPNCQIVVETPTLSLLRHIEIGHSTPINQLDKLGNGLIACLLDALPASRDN